MPNRCTPISRVGEGSRTFPLSREAGEGDTGGEGYKTRPHPPHTLGTIAPASEILCQTVVPLSAEWERGVGAHGSAPVFSGRRKLRFRTPQSPARLRESWDKVRNRPQSSRNPNREGEPYLRD